MTANWTLCFVLLGAPMILMRMLYLLALNPFCGFCDRAVARNRDINTQGQWARTNVDKWATWKWSISTIVVDLNLNPLRQVKTEGARRGWSALGLGLSWFNYCWIRCLSRPASDNNAEIMWMIKQKTRRPLRTRPVAPFKMAWQTR